MGLADLCGEVLDFSDDGVDGFDSAGEFDLEEFYYWWGRRKRISGTKNSNFLYKKKLFLTPTPHCARPNHGHPYSHKT